MFNAICTILTWYLILLLSVASIAKFLSPATSFVFYEQLGIPINHLQTFSIVAIAIELSTAILLTIRKYRFFGAALSMMLCGMFIVVHLVMPGDCGCFGDIRVQQKLVLWTVIIGFVSSACIAHNQRHRNECD